MDVIKGPLHSGNIQKATFAYAGVDMAKVEIPSVAQAKKALYARLATELKNPKTKAKRRAKIRKQIKALNYIFKHFDKNKKTGEFTGKKGTVVEGARINITAKKKVSKTVNDKTMQEFMHTKKVGYEFIKYVSINHPDELRAIGLCDFAIVRGEKGLTPFNKKGKRYKYKYDHVPPRAEAGAASETKAVDIKAPKYMGETLLVNHFDKIKMVVTDYEEEFKNVFGLIQGSSRLKEGEVALHMSIDLDEVPNASNHVMEAKNEAQKATVAEELNAGYVFDEVVAINYLTDVFDRAAEEVVTDEKASSLYEVFNKTVVKATVLNKLSTKIDDIKEQLSFAFDRAAEFIEGLDEKQEKLTKQEERDKVSLVKGFVKVVEALEAHSVIQNLNMQSAKTLRENIVAMKDDLVGFIPPKEDQQQEVKKTASTMKPV